MKRRNFLSLITAGLATESLSSSLSGLFPVAGLGTQAMARGKSSSSVHNRNYNAFLDEIRSHALGQGLSSDIVDQALALAPAPNRHVLALDRRQPEFTMSWAQYRDKVITQSRLEESVTCYQNVRAVLDPLAERTACDPYLIMGIWGLESGFGKKQGNFNVIEALATLGFDGRRAKFFKSELLKALKILNAGDIAPAAMMGSYAGAMGQPQFMPSAYLSYAIDGDGDGKRDIWHSQADVFASIGNYLSAHKWQKGDAWGQEVTVPLGRDGAVIALGSKKSRHAPRRSIAEWQSLGVQPIPGGQLYDSGQQAALLQPDGVGGQAFLVYPNFYTIRSYNPSDYYALAVGLLGDHAVKGG